MSAPDACAATIRCSRGVESGRIPRPLRTPMSRVSPSGRAARGETREHRIDTAVAGYVRVCPKVLLTLLNPGPIFLNEGAARRQIQGYGKSAVRR